MKEVINAKFVWTLYEKDNYRVVRYKTDSPVLLPNGKMTCAITANGDCPTVKGASYKLTGEFKEFKKEGKQGYSFSLLCYEEILPTNEDNIIAYLKTLDGVGDKTANEIFKCFTYSVFSVLDENPEKLTEISGISTKKAEKIAASYSKRCGQKDLFEYLFKYSVSESVIIRLSKEYGKESLKNVKENPFILMDFGLNFYACDYIASKEGIGKNDPKRLKAGILEVLKQNEQGGNLFTSKGNYPEFVYDRFLEKPIFDLMQAEKDNSVIGSTYLPYFICYLKLLKLLDTPVEEEYFKRLLISLKLRNKVFYIKDEDHIEQSKIFLYQTYEAECNAALYISKLLKKPAYPISELKEKIEISEAALGYRLSIEQKNAVKTALNSCISIISGGPGTGKSSILKVIIDVFRASYPYKRVVLAAPTGQAAKRMFDVTGIPSYTIHSLLGIRHSEDPSEGYADLADSLIIIDETSMLGSKLLCSLLSSVGRGSQIIFVGDCDQLPSVEVGCCLRELIFSKKIPTAFLTQTFRQKNGSNIALNAARIRLGETNLETGEDFKIFKESSEENIVKRVCDLYEKNVNSFGIDNVIVLSPFYKNTITGVKALNNALRNVVRPELSEKTPFFDKLGVRFFEGDRIMFTKNAGDLINGDVGYISKIYFLKGKPCVIADFEGKTVELDEDSLNSVKLAYAQTVHKSQGLEYACCIIVIDPRHSYLLNKPIVYTAITRCKKSCCCVIGDYSLDGQDPLEKAILTEDLTLRASILSSLI